jgi:hypothetical protein
MVDILNKIRLLPWEVVVFLIKVGVQIFKEFRS